MSECSVGCAAGRWLAAAAVCPVVCVVLLTGLVVTVRVHTLELILIYRSYWQSTNYGGGELPHTDTDTHTHTHTHARTHRRAHLHAQTHTHMHTHMKYILGCYSYTYWVIIVIIIIL